MSWTGNGNVLRGSVLLLVGEPCRLRHELLVLFGWLIHQAASCLHALRQSTLTCHVIKSALLLIVTWTHILFWSFNRYWLLLLIPGWLRPKSDFVSQSSFRLQSGKYWIASFAVLFGGFWYGVGCDIILNTVIVVVGRLTPSLLILMDIRLLLHLLWFWLLKVHWIWFLHRSRRCICLFCFSLIRTVVILTWARYHLFGSILYESFLGWPKDSSLRISFLLDLQCQRWSLILAGTRRESLVTWVLKSLLFT